MTDFAGFAINKNVSILRIGTILNFCLFTIYKINRPNELSGLEKKDLLHFK